MRKIYFTSDLHFGHDNLCHKLRGMTSEECDALIIENWNRVVRDKSETEDGDKVYILGDISMDKPEYVEKIRQLNGEKIVIGGNHDTVRCCQKLNELGITVIGCLEHKKFICTHIPVHPSQLEGLRGNIHGHIHKRGEGDNAMNHARMVTDDPRYYNVNCELHDYTPVLFDRIIRALEEE